MYKPLADEIRPHSLDDVVGQKHILGQRGLLRRIALLTFDGTYDAETVDKWLNVFMRRFFAQQFKRSCMPDGPKVGSVSLSPRGDWRMPSDAVNSAFRPE